MSERRKRRTFSEAFKAEAVRLVRDEGKTVAAAARALDLAEWTCSDLADTWVKLPEPVNKNETRGS